MRLLIVEDETDLRQSLEKAMREEGFAVDTAPDGDEGLYLAENNDYDAIVLDVMMPSKDGWQVLAHLRERKRTPVLMLTARDGVRDRVKGLDLGADDYLIKPFNLAELIARVRALIRRSAAQPNPVLSFEDISIDTTARVVSLRGKPVEITAREYALIEYLAFRRGKLVSRTELYEHLFAEDDNTLSNLLDVHVCNVRKKLGRDFIQTRRGHGYIVD